MPNPKKPDEYRLSVIISGELAQRARVAAAQEHLSLIKLVARAVQTEVMRIEEEQANLRAGLTRQLVDGALQWVKPAKKGRSS